MHRPPTLPLSRGFLAALIGIGITILAWYGPWLWPAWPATTTLDFVLARAGWSDVSFTGKAFGMVGLIVVNVGFWAVVARVVMMGGAGLLAARRRSASHSE